MTDDELRTLIYLAVFEQVCPFCMTAIGEPSLFTIARRARDGLSPAEAELVKQGFDIKTGHKVGCRGIAISNEIEKMIPP